MIVSDLFKPTATKYDTVKVIVLLGGKNNRFNEYTFEIDDECDMYDLNRYMNCTVIASSLDVRKRTRFSKFMKVEIDEPYYELTLVVKF